MRFAWNDRELRVGNSGYQDVSVHAVRSSSR
jgi:hypothetical protein